MKKFYNLETFTSLFSSFSVLNTALTYEPRREKTGFLHMRKAEAIRTTVVPIRILIRTTVVPITPLIRTTVVRIRILIGTTGI